MSNKKHNGFWKYMFPYMKNHKTRIIITSVFSVLVGTCLAVQPLIIKYIVDDGISNNLLNSREKMEMVLFLCLFYILISTIRIGAWKFAYSNIVKVLEQSLFNLRSHFFSHVQNMSMKFYNQISVGELFNCLMGSPIINIKEYMRQLFLNLPYQIVSLVISLIALSAYDLGLTLILLITVLIMAILNYISRKKMRSVFDEYLKVETKASHYINDTLHGMDAIKLYSIEDNTFNEFKNFTTNMYEKSIKANIKQMNESFKPEYVQYLGTAVVYLVGAFSCIYKGMSVGILYAFLSSMGNILGIFISWLNLNLVKTSAESGLHKILMVMDINTTTPEKELNHLRDMQTEKEIAINKKRACIELKNVFFGYDSKTILKNINLSINYNESIALVGGSGSGKSTLTKLLMRLYDINDGNILIHSRDIKDYSLHDLRTTFGVVPQNPFIFYGSIWDNILIARPLASNKEVIKAMEIAHVHEFVNELEKGWNTIIGDGALNLSGGQKQRIAIARAILGNPDILIFDEATSALDNISEKHIQKAMESLMKTHTIIIVAHRLSTIKHVDRIVVMNEGEIIQEGTYDELSNKEGLFYDLLNSK